MFNEIIKLLAAPSNSLAPALSYYGAKTRVKLTESCLKQDKITFIQGKAVNIYIVYELNASGFDTDEPTLKYSLFGALTLIKNSDIDKNRYSGYGIGFDSRGSFPFPGGEFGSNVITFGVDMSSSVHVDNRKKYILIFGSGPTQG